MDYLGEKPRQDSVQIGVKRSGSDGLRPIKVSSASSAYLAQILRAAKKWKSSDKFKSVFICPDLTPEERELKQKAVTDLKKILEEQPDKRNFI